MGNSESIDETPAATLPVTADNDYKWPENLYVETRDMAAASFMVYSFGYILDTARKDGLKGMDVDTQGHVSKNNSTSTSQLNRSFTPQEVKEIIADNRDALVQRYEDFATPQLLEASLQLLEDRALESGMDRPLTLVEFDDHHQDKEMVYAVAKDDVNRRITLCFRGTDNQLAKDTNWSTNISFRKMEADLPDVIDKNKAIWFHGGFYNYIFGTTATTEDAPDKRKYDEILEDIKPLLEANPDYKLYVTGHSLGGALATIVSFYLACDDSVVSHPVTCLTFAAPRVGDYHFLEACTALEKAKRLRILRIVNHKDSIPMLPMINFYHAGFQIRLYDDPSYEPEVTYPKLVDSYWNRWCRTWGNSLITSFNLSYDHGEYRERVEENSEFLKTLDLKELYNNVDMTGFAS